MRAAGTPPVVPRFTNHFTNGPVRVVDVAVRPVNVLAFCAGGGGLERGITFVVSGAQLGNAGQRGAYAAATLLARIAIVTLDTATIWGDVTTLEGQPRRGEAERHVVSAAEIDAPEERKTAFIVADARCGPDVLGDQMTAIWRTPKALANETSEAARAM